MLVPWLLKEKVVRLSELKKDLKKLRGFVRVVNDKNHMSTKGFFMDEKTLRRIHKYILKSKFANTHATTV